MVADAGTPASPGASTPKKDLARSTITRTTITPAPGTEVATVDDGGEAERSWRDRFRPHVRGRLAPAQEPYPGTSTLRFVMSTLLTVLCLLTVGGAILLLLLWQQDRASGVLTSQVERTWDLFDLLREIERWVAFVTAPIAVAWIALATVNVRRATGERRNAIVAAASLPVGVVGAWIVGSRIVAESEDLLGEISGVVLQAIFLAIPLLALERIVTSADARHRPLRVAYVISVLYLAQLQLLGGLSTVDQTSGPDLWARLGAYLIIGALLQVLGALAANEAARAVEESTEHRYQLRHRFGESLLSQADARRH